MNNTIDKINNYLQVGGMFNPELMEHHKVSDLLLECRNELQKANAQIENLKEFVLFVDRWTNYKPNKSEKPTSYEDCVKIIAPMAAEFACTLLEKKR